jgi:hypothetical protein
MCIQIESYLGRSGTIISHSVKRCSRSVLSSEKLCGISEAHEYSDWSLCRFDFVAIDPDLCSTYIDDFSAVYLGVVQRDLIYLHDSTPTYVGPNQTLVNFAKVFC